MGRTACSKPRYSSRALRASCPRQSPPTQFAPTIDEALRAREADERRVILFNLSGHGHFDMGAYDAYQSGALQDYAYPAEAIEAALTELPKVAAPV